MRLFVAGLLLAQTLAVFLIAKALRDQSNRIDAIAATLPSKLVTSVAPSTHVKSPTTETRRRDPLSEMQLRRIIAEEVDRALRSLAETREPDPSTDTPEPADVLEDASREELIAQELEHHISVGVISAKDMGTLQAKIARLNIEARKRMLRRLVGAMNDGSLKGRL